jgi:hypothetical protein
MGLAGDFRFSRPEGECAGDLRCRVIARDVASRHDPLQAKPDARPAARFCYHAP